MNNRTKINIIDCIVIIFTISLTISLLLASKSCIKQTPQQPDVLDSIKIEKAKFDEEVKQLDSIKNAKIISVKKLDDDSSIILFYELIRK